VQSFYILTLLVALLCVLSIFDGFAVAGIVGAILFSYQALCISSLQQKFEDDKRDRVMDDYRNLQQV